MALNFFPLDDASIGIDGAIPIFVDSGCTIRATLYDTNGAVLRGNSLFVGSSDRLPTFQANATVVYTRDAGGRVVTIYPHPAKNSPIITGSKGANAALTSLITALANEGLIVDQTT